MIKLIRKVAEWGISPETPMHQAHHYRLTNVLLLFMFFASIGQTILCFVTGAIDAGLLNSTAPLVFGGGLYLMKLGYTTFARIFVVTIAYTAGYAVCTSLGPESYFQFIFLFASAFSIAFFSTDEKRLLFFGMVTPLLTFSLLETTHYEPIWGLARAQLSATQTLAMRIISITLIWSLMVAHFYYFIRDRRKSQENLVSSAKMVAMGRMAAGIAHEVNNPLQLIFLHVERLKTMARSGTITTEQINKASEKIQSVAQRISSINKGLLALSRDVADDPFSEVPVDSIVNLALDFCRTHLEANQVDLRVKTIPQQWTAMGRETQLSEVVLNVLNNAYDAVIESPQKWIELNATADKNWIEISISDSGPGIPAKIRPRIFDPFFTTKEAGKGTGLGLSISQNIMAAHGGQIYYDYESQSAKFIVRIPRGPDRVIERDLSSSI